jgi:Domain of unknown function (DUF4259)
MYAQDISQGLDVGAWGVGVFANDTACDFAATVAEGADLAVLEQALDRVLACEGGDVDARLAEEGLAAADVIARLNGRPGVQTAYTAKIDVWVARTQLMPSKELVEKARRSNSRILAEPSELLELWQDAGLFDEWKHSVEEVSERL